jgi:hypothetical protein
VLASRIIPDRAFREFSMQVINFKCSRGAFCTKLKNIYIWQHFIPWESFVPFSYLQDKCQSSIEGAPPVDEVFFPVNDKGGGTLPYF